MIAWTYVSGRSTIADIPPDTLFGDRRGYCTGAITMKNNIRLSAFFGVIAVLVAGEPLATPDAATSWATPFPFAQAGFAQPAPAR